MSPVIKRGGDKFTIPGKYLLFILTIVAVALMVITLTTNLFSGIANTIAGMVVVPFQRGITAAGTFLIDEAGRLENIEQLQKENEELRAQVDQLTEQNMQLTQDRYELNTLRELYELDAQYEAYEKVGAHVIAKDSGNWFYSFIIDKGLDDGLSLDMNIIADGGLVGRITTIGPDWAKVTTIIADNFSVSGMVLSTSDNLIVTGNLETYENGVITFSKLQDSADIVAVGDKVVTSNISDKYLPEILIGYITTIESDSNNLTKSGTITPVVDFEHIDEVLVITTLKQTVDDSTAVSAEDLSSYSSSTEESEDKSTETSDSDSADGENVDDENTDDISAQ